jgi:MoaA/NifB/PqqE/SkfB family radical SAM enzyme
MEIQSLSIVVPTKGCVCKCKTCVSRIHGHEEHYPNLIEKITDENNWPLKEEYRRRLEFARDNGCNTMILTGAPGEPVQNMEFLKKLTSWNTSLRKPFYWIELQTSGVMLDWESLRELKILGVSTISLSNFNIFDDEDNWNVMGISSALYYNLDELCKLIKQFGFNLRMSMNMTKVYETKTLEEIFNRLVALGVDQVTFRQLYTSEKESEINDYIRKNAINVEPLRLLDESISNLGTALEVLPFGARKYSYRGIGAVVDTDCMSKRPQQTVRYLILRENCKLYSKWDDRGSLIF